MNFIKQLLISVSFIIIGCMIIVPFVPNIAKPFIVLILFYAAIVSFYRGVSNPIRRYYKVMYRQGERTGWRAYTMRDLEMDTDELFSVWENSSNKRRGLIRKTISDAINYKRYVLAYQL